MNILIIGSGGREDALAWKISQSSKVKQLYIAPGNAGTGLYGKNVELNVAHQQQLKDFVQQNNITMLVVGPEIPLVNGIANKFTNDKELEHVAVIGPCKRGAILEGSKDFSKSFMQKYDIPTARSQTVSKNNIKAGVDFLQSVKSPYVLKADGLAAGKGVLIIDNLQEAINSLTEMLDGKFGQASEKVVIEEYLHGIEASIFIITDGKNYKILPASKDYKRIGENDTGLNTGGMGAVSPVPFANDVFIQKVEQQIIKPTINGLINENIEYKGFLYFGLMNVNDEPKVIEYNVRMGDPETQAVIPRIKSDIVDLFEGVANNTLNTKKLEIDPRFVATVVLVANGYPEAYEKGDIITGIENTKDCIVFHAGTKLKDDKILTNGGRVLSVSAYSENLKDALKKCYENIKHINFSKKNYRKDIGKDLLNE